MIDTKAWFPTKRCTCSRCESLRRQRADRQLARWFEIAAAAEASRGEVRSFEDVADLIQSAIS